MPPDLRRHARYPETLFRVQAEIVSNRETEAEVEIFKSGARVANKVEKLKPGVNRFEFTQTVKGDERLAYFERLRDAAAALPGVMNVGGSVLTPVGTTRWNTLVEQSADIADLPERQRISWVNLVLPGWFKTFETPLLEGR